MTGILKGSAAAITMAFACYIAPFASAQSDPAPKPSSVPENCLPKSWLAPAPSYRSVEVLPDGRVTFRLCAPLASEAKVLAGDVGEMMPSGTTNGIANGLPMSRDRTGLWTATTPGSVASDTYRFTFQVDGAPVPDPRGTDWSEHLNGIESVFEVSGAGGAFQAYDAAVPHGTVAEIEYFSKSLGIKRRAHVYTPPGYMGDAKHYPVLYLVHGAGDSDDSWTSVGHANYILDNLIASGKAKPMIVVMPAGHTPPRDNQTILRNQDFGNDLLKDLIPLVDRSYRTVARPESRAMAGLSMGGAHTIQFGLPHSELFRYVGIFSMGLGVQDKQAEVASFTRANDAGLRQSAKLMRLVYYAIGRDDFLYATVAPTRAMLNTYRIRHTYAESDGGHTWINWRRYFRDFAPKLFR